MLLEASPEMGPHKFGFIKRQMAGRLRTSWQKRGCEVRNGFLKIIETEGSQEPTKLSLVTCEMRPDDENKLNFSVTARYQSHNNIRRMCIHELLVLLFTPYRLLVVGAILI